MILYFTPGSSSLAAHIVAREARISIAYDKVNLKTLTTESGQDYTRINPKGYVPALSLPTGEVLTEAAVVLQFLADLAPEMGLIPEGGSIERYRVQEWLGFIGTELHKTFMPIWKPTSAAACQQSAIEQLHRRFGFLDRHLDGRSYLLGENFTVADAYCYAILNWTTFHRIDISPYLHMSAFMKRVAARPHTREALQIEGLLKGGA